MRHYQEEFNLLVASRETGVTTNTVEGKRIPPVSLLSVSIPVQFQISDVRKWAYKHMEPANLLEDIGTREVVHYLVGVDLLEIMSTGRFKAAEELRKRIQDRANEEELGVKIVFRGFAGHPSAGERGGLLRGGHRRDAKAGGGTVEGAGRCGGHEFMGAGRGVAAAAQRGSGGHRAGRWRRRRRPRGSRTKFRRIERRQVFIHSSRMHRC